MTNVLALQMTDTDELVPAPEPTNSNLSIACTGHSSVSYNCGAK